MQGEGKGIKKIGERKVIHSHAILYLIDEIIWQF
jgi:hypothetical protein